MGIFEKLLRMHKKKSGFLVIFISHVSGNILTTLKQVHKFSHTCLQLCYRITYGQTYLDFFLKKKVGIFPVILRIFCAQVKVYVIETAD